MIPRARRHRPDPPHPPPPRGYSPESVIVKTIDIDRRELRGLAGDGYIRTRGHGDYRLYCWTDAVSWAVAVGDRGVLP